MRPNEPLTPLQLLALALAHEGEAISDAADAIPDSVWHELDDRGLVVSGSRIFGRSYTTAAGDAALFDWIEFYKQPRLAAV